MRCFNFHPPKNNYERNYIPPWNYNIANLNLGPFQQQSLNSRSWTIQHSNPGFRQSPGRGKPVGYWSLPHHIFPLITASPPCLK